MADYTRQSKADLEAEAARRNLDVGDSPNKQDLVNALHEDDRRQGDTDQGGAGQGSAQTADQPPPAVQVGRGEHGVAAADTLAVQAHGDVPLSQASGEDTAAKAGLGADDDRAGAQTSAAEGVAAAEAGNLRVQEQVDAENIAGYRGVNPDPTPNRNYTAEGAARGLPTPETDADAYQAAQQALRAGGGRFPATESAQRQHELAREHQQKVAEATREQSEG